MTTALPVSPVLVADAWLLTAPDAPDVADGFRVMVPAPPAPPLA